MPRQKKAPEDVRVPLNKHSVSNIRLLEAEHHEAWRALETQQEELTRRYRAQVSLIVSANCPDDLDPTTVTAVHVNSEEGYALLTLGGEPVE